jgi:hypothetical protein
LFACACGRRYNGGMKASSTYVSDNCTHDGARHYDGRGHLRCESCDIERARERRAFIDGVTIGISAVVILLWLTAFLR